MSICITSLELAVEMLSLNINLTFIITIFYVCHRRWSPKVKFIICAAIINIINTIWFTRNNRFNNIIPSFNSAVAMITDSVLLSCNLTKAVTGPAISDFVVLKAFKIDTQWINNADGYGHKFQLLFFSIRKF